MCVRWLWRCLLFLPAVDSKGDETCWMDGVTWEQCCAAKFGPEGNGACWGGDFTFERCCIDAEPAEVPPELAAASATSYPACWHPGVVLRHAGENGIFADLSLYGHTGCFLNNCKLTDKFAAVDAGVCSRACSEVEECSHWTFGQQYGVKTCFLRKSDAGRAFLPHWISGTSDCAPPRLPPAWVALRTAKCEGLRACDAGKGEGCPDVEAAITTWLFAIDHMKRAFSGRVDQDTWSHIERIGKESANFRAGLHSEYRPSDKDFPRIIYNNRLIFNHLEEALSSQPAGTATADDASLPLETAADAVLALITSVCQIRSVLDSASEEDIYQFLSADETQICEQVLKYAVLVTSNEVAHLHRCQDTWVGNMETRLDRLMRAAEIADAAQQQLLVVEAQLAGLGGQQKGKVKKVLGHFACASSRSLACAVLAAWRGSLEQTKADKALRDMYEEQIADAERHLLRMKASCKALAKDNVDHMAKAREQVLLQQWLLLWQREVGAVKCDRVAQEQVQQVLGRVCATAKKQASHTTRVMTRQAREQQAALLGETWALWLCFVSDCRKERLFEQDVKHFELRMKEHLRQKTQEARMIFDRVGAATRTGLLASILWAWQCSVTEGRKLQGIQNQVMEASQEVDGLKMRQSTAICNVQMRTQKLMDSSLVISVISAWSRETKENHLEKFYSNKVDSKRKQLTAVQTLFKSFARDLEEGLKQVDGDSSGRESTRRSRSKQGITSTN